MPKPLPPLPPQPVHNPFVLFSPSQWTWLVQALTTLHQGQGILMATIEELQTALDAQSAATDAAATAIEIELDQLKAAVDALAAAAPVDLQPQVDQVNASTAKLSAAVDALNADDPAV